MALGGHDMDIGGATRSTSWGTARSTSWGAARSTSWGATRSSSWGATRSSSWGAARSTSWGRGHYHLIIASTATTRPMESLTALHREDHRHAPSPRIPDKPQPYNLPRHALPLVVRHPPPSLGCVSTTYPRPSEPEHLRFHNRGSHLTPLPVSGVWSSPGSPAPRDLTIGTHPHRAFQISHSHTTCLAMPCPWLYAIPSLGCVSTTYPRPSEPEHLRFHNRGSHLTPLPVSGVWSSPGSAAP